MRRWRLPLAALVLLTAALVAAEVTTGRSGGERAEAPPLPSEVLSGEAAGLGAMRGTPVAINFWASWCPPCRREAPAIERLATMLNDRARLIGVDWNDTRAGAREFIDRYGWTFTNLRDASGSVGDAYGIQGLPTTVVVDAGGRIATTLHGPQTAASVQAALRSAER